MSLVTLWTHRETFDCPRTDDVARACTELLPHIDINISQFLEFVKGLKNEITKLYFLKIRKIQVFILLFITEYGII